MAERQTAERTAMRAEEVPGMGLQLAASPLPSPPHPLLPPVNHLRSTPGPQNPILHWLLAPFMPNPCRPHPFKYPEDPRNPHLLG